MKLKQGKLERGLISGGGGGGGAYKRQFTVFNSVK